MGRDFFLLNRCFQLAKICRDPSGSGFVLPPPKLRGKLPSKLNDFYSLLERIVSIADDNAASPADASKVELSVDGQAQLADSQRHDLEDFERVVVAYRFSVDESLKQPAVTLIRAIFADAAYFSGLKPLPQYTDAFAYELLFPSWLNLLKAAMLPRADNGKPRLEGARQGALFEFLGKTTAINECQSRLLVGFLTFVASRNDAPQCEDLLQRLVDLVGQLGGKVVDELDAIDSISKDARALHVAFVDYLIVQTSLLPCIEKGDYAIGYQRPLRRPIPDFVAGELNKRADAQQWLEFLAMAHPLRLLLESKHALSAKYISLLSKNVDKIEPLLGLIAFESLGTLHVVTEEGQAATAELIAAQPDLLNGPLVLLQKFARDIASELTCFSEATREYFIRALVIDPSGRQSLLDALHSEAARDALVEQLLSRAGNTDDSGRHRSLIACASLLWSQAEANEARASLEAIDAVVQNRTIGNKELGDLIADLQANPLQALQYLASPMLAAAGKSPRVAALYLTLNEVSQKLTETGTVDNFSVVRAKYAKLTNMELD